VIATACLTEDQLLALAVGANALGDATGAEAHLASCATCSALLASAVRRPPARAWNELAGQLLGPYRLDAQIGAGGMGAVYRAWDPRLGRAIAIKVLHGGGSIAAEARAAAAIDHRAIVAIHDVGEADGLAYVAMELAVGESLRRVLARGGLGVARARALTAELVDALVAAHARGVVHRDLKPENVVLARDGLRVLDFGLAARAGESSAGGGTAGYMAPEQARGEPGDARSDLFAVGAIAFELVTGSRAFPGASHGERLAATLRDEPATAALGELAPIVERCLAKEPAERFQTAADLAWVLRAASAPAAPRRLTRRALLGAGAAAVVAAAAGYFVGRRRPAGAPVFASRPLTHRTGRVYTARFTHDGTRVLYGASWGAEPVAIRQTELSTGETTALELPSADVLAVSPRGDVAANVGLRYVDHQSAQGTLTLVAPTGGTSRPIANDIQDADFVPGGDAIAVVRATDAGYRIESPIGTALATEPWATHVRVSPDATQLAYLRHPHSNDDAGELVVVDLATRASRVLSTGWASLAGLVWDPSGRALWFTASRRDLANRLHRISLAGEVVPILGPTADRLRIHDVATDGRVLVTVDNWRMRAVAGERDVSLSEISYVSDLSADGSQLVIGELGDVEGGTGAYLVRYAGGPPLRLGAGFPLAISPSGERIAANVDVADHLVVYSTRTGESPAIATPGLVTAARWIDERTLIALFDHALWRLAIGAPPIQIAASARAFVLDPARTRCAYVDRAHALHVIDLVGGASRKVPLVLSHEEPCGWLAEPDAIVVRSTTTPLVLDRIDAATGARAHHRDVQPPLVGLKAVDTFVLHADGVRAAYSYGQELSQLVVLTPQV
jgi:hypothetical protein